MWGLMGIDGVKEWRKSTLSASRDDGDDDVADDEEE